MEASLNNPQIHKINQSHKVTEHAQDDGQMNEQVDGYGDALRSNFKIENFEYFRNFKILQ
jgi:hypothetical protein